MELTAIERQLWNNFRDVVWADLRKQFDNYSYETNEINPMVIESMIDTTLDLYAYTYSNMPHNGINRSRAEEIISGVAYLTKKNLMEKFFG